MRVGHGVHRARLCQRLCQSLRQFLPAGVPAQGYECGHARAHETPARTAPQPGVAMHLRPQAQAQALWAAGLAVARPAPKGVLARYRGQPRRRRVLRRLKLRRSHLEAPSAARALQHHHPAARRAGAAGCTQRRPALHPLVPTSPRRMAAARCATFCRCSSLKRARFFTCRAMRGFFESSVPWRIKKSQYSVV